MTYHTDTWDDMVGDSTAISSVGDYIAADSHSFETMWQLNQLPCPRSNRGIQRHQMDGPNYNRDRIGVHQLP